MTAQPQEGCVENEWGGTAARMEEWGGKNRRVSRGRRKQSIKRLSQEAGKSSSGRGPHAPGAHASPGGGRARAPARSRPRSQPRPEIWPAPLPRPGRQAVFGGMVPLQPGPARAAAVAAAKRHTGRPSGAQAANSCLCVSSIAHQRALHTRNGQPLPSRRPSVCKAQQLERAREEARRSRRLRTRPTAGAASPVPLLRCHQLPRCLPLLPSAAVLPRRALKPRKSLGAT